MSHISEANKPQCVSIKIQRTLGVYTVHSWSVYRLPVAEQYQERTGLHSDETGQTGSMEEKSECCIWWYYRRERDTLKVNALQMFAKRKGKDLGGASIPRGGGKFTTPQQDTSACSWHWEAQFSYRLAGIYKIVICRRMCICAYQLQVMPQEKYKRALKDTRELPNSVGAEFVATFCWIVDINSSVGRNQLPTFPKCSQL